MLHVLVACVGFLFAALFYFLSSDSDSFKKKLLTKRN